jgi:hypothetical protein
VCQIWIKNVDSFRSKSTKWLVADYRPSSSLFFKKPLIELGLERKKADLLIFWT